MAVTPGGRITVLHSQPTAPPGNWAAEARLSAVGQRRLFVTREDAIAAGARWMERHGLTDVVVIECDVIGSLKLREAPVVFVPAKKQRKVRRRK